MEPVLADLRLLLATPDRDSGWNYDRRTSMPRYNVEKRTIAQWLAAAHTAHLHMGDAAAADADLTALLQLAAWHDEDFTLVSQMFRSALGSLAGACTWSALQATNLTAPQLAAYQARWEKLTLLPATTAALQFERVWMDDLFVQLRNGTVSYSSVMGTGAVGWDKAGEQAMALAWRASMAEADELFYLRYMQGHIDALRQLGKTRSWAVAAPRFATNSAQLSVLYTWPGRLMILSGMAAPNMDRIFTTLHRYEAEREMTITALALERFRLRHRRYPAALADLVPEFVAAVPVDWLDGKPLR
ncbi:MAG: hypothetical protein ACKODH_03085 [Limisphaerales bacterium]